MMAAMTAENDAGETPDDQSVPVAAVIAAAGPDSSAAFCTVVAAADSYSASIPLKELKDGGWLAVSEGESDPGDRGSPLRLTVREGKTLCWNVKGVTELRFTATKEPDSLPERPSH